MVLKTKYFVLLSSQTKEEMVSPFDFENQMFCIVIVTDGRVWHNLP